MSFAVQYFRWLLEFLWPVPREPYLVKAKEGFDVSSFNGVETRLLTDYVQFYKLELSQKEVENLTTSPPPGFIALAKENENSSIGIALN